SLHEQQAREYLPKPGRDQQELARYGFVGASGRSNARAAAARVAALPARVRAARALSAEALQAIHSGALPFTINPRMGHDQVVRRAGAVGNAVRAGKLSELEGTRRLIAAGVLVPQPAGYVEHNPIVRTLAGLDEDIVGLPA